MNDLDPDTQERNDTLLNIEGQLEGQRRGDPETLTTGHIIMSKCVRVLQHKVAAMEGSANKRRAPTWPTAGIICSIIFGIVTLLTK